MSKYWYQKNLRFLQTVLREIDIINYDAAAVVEYMKKSNTNCLVVNAGGVIDFFENPLEMANENRFRNGQDILADICREVHKAGLNVIVRVDFRGVEQRRYDLHPDWFAKDQDQNPKNNLSKAQNLKIMTPCYNSYYTSTHAVEYIRYLMKTYDIDGIWENALGFDNLPCYCRNCRDKYFADTGNEIPRIPEGMKPLDAMELPLFKDYRKWKAVQADIHIERLRAAVKEFGGDKAFCAEIFDLYNHHFTKATSIDHSNAKKSFDFIVSCVFLNSNGSPSQYRTYDIIYNSATTIRFSRALDPKKQPVIVTGGNGTRWRYTADPLLETRLWMWEIASVGGGIWNCYFNGQCPSLTHDRRNAYSEKDVYTYLADNSERLSDTVPVRDVAIYYSNATRDRFTRDNEYADEYGTFIRGTERVLLEHHIQYGFLPDSEFTAEALRGVKALLIPNGALMSDKDIALVKEYVKNGGGLIASYNTSLYDENGRQRRDFGLSELFGASFTGTVLDTQNDSYQLVADKGSPVLADIGDTDVLINGAYTLLCAKADPAYNTVSTYIPTIPNQPPEYSWLPDMKTDYPIILSGSYGKGRVVYFANRVEALCFTHGHEDYTEIYKNAVDFVSGGGYALHSKAPRSVHVNAVEDQANPNRIVISFVNTTGTAQRPMKEVVPVFDFATTVALNGRKLDASTALWGDGIEVKAENDQVVVKIAKLDEFASVELKLV